MSVLGRLASALGRNDEVPNQELAAEIAQYGDAGAVAELAAQLGCKDRAIESDSIKVLYEVGERRPDLIAPHVDAFIDQLSSKNNRMVWGAMTALGMIAGQTAARIWPRVGEVIRTNDAGSVITQDWGIRVLSDVSGAQPEYEARLFPYLLRFLETTIPRDVPKHAASIMATVNSGNQAAFLEVLDRRAPELKPSQMTRVRKIYKTLGR